MGFGQNLDWEMGFVAPIKNPLNNIHYCAKIYIKNVKIHTFRGCWLFISGENANETIFLL